jgi:hypothetical protein
MSPKITFREIAGEELERAEEQWAYSSLVEKCRLWAVAMCRIARGHDWQLDINPYEGAVYLDCRWCPAGIDDIYPDGIDLLNGDFEVCPGYVLNLRSVNGIEVNEQPCDGMFTYGWRGPVTVDLHVEKYTSMDWIGPEHDVWIEVNRGDP